MSKLYTEEEIRKLLNEILMLSSSVDDAINSLTPIEPPTDEERDKKFFDFLQKEHELGISDKATIERIEWYYDMYFAIDKIQGGGDE